MIVVTSEPLRTDQRDREVDEQRDRDDQLEDVGETHTWSSQTTNAAASRKKPTISTTITRSIPMSRAYALRISGS